MLYRLYDTEHGVHIELNAHIVEFISEFGIGVDLFFMGFCEVVEVGLELDV
jgi:hypothetical protein